MARVKATATLQADKTIADKKALVAELRARVAAQETTATGEAVPTVPLGAAAVDAALPGGGLRLAGLHEVRAAHYLDLGAATGFATALLARLAAARPEAPVVVGERSVAPFDMGCFYGRGVAGLGLSPERCLFLRPQTMREALWALEECVRSGVPAAVLAKIEPSALDLTASRRLQLAAEQAQCPLLLLTGYESAVAGEKPSSKQTSKPAGTSAGTSAGSVALTRWRIAACAGRQETGCQDAWRQPLWEVSLERCRHGRPGRWHLIWQPTLGQFSEWKDAWVKAAPSVSSPDQEGRGRVASPGVSAMVSLAEGPAMRRARA